VKPEYNYTVDDAVLRVFAESKKRHREELLRIFARLAADPFINGDSTRRDAAGRDCQVKRFGGWSLTYWPEHFAKQIHIIDVERLLQRRVSVQALEISGTECENRVSKTLANTSKMAVNYNYKFKSL